MVECQKRTGKKNGLIKTNHFQRNAIRETVHCKKKVTIDKRKWIKGTIALSQILFNHSIEFSLWGLTARYILNAQYRLHTSSFQQSVWEYQQRRQPSHLHHSPFSNPVGGGKGQLFKRAEKQETQTVFPLTGTHGSGYSAAGVPTARLRRQRRKNFDCHAEPGELAGLLRLLCTPSSENVNETSKLLTRARDKKRLAAETVNKHRRQSLYRITWNGFIPAKVERCQTEPNTRLHVVTLLFPPEVFF